MNKEQMIISQNYFSISFLHSLTSSSSNNADGTPKLPVQAREEV